MSKARKGVDWDEIQKRILAGESAYRISKDLKGRVSRQHIRHVALKEGWVAALEQGHTAVLEAAQRPYERPRYKDTPDRRNVILEAVAGGMPRSHAAQFAGINRDTLKAWAAKDSEFENQLIQAERAFQRDKLGEIDKAGKRGDWKASAWMLEKHPVTKPDYAPKAESQAGGVVINVSLNIPRADAGEMITLTAEQGRESPVENQQIQGSEDQILDGQGIAKITNSAA